MKRFGLLIIGTLAVCAAWAALVFMTLSEGWSRSTLVESEDPQAFLAAAQAEAMASNRGNLAFVMLEDGREVGSFTLSQGDPVERDTLFQVASLGKWLTAWGVMALVEEGRIDLDAPVSTYVTRWQLPASEFDADGVTIRRLLSHTAGLDDGEILEANQIIGYFNYVNRLLNGLGVTTEGDVVGYYASGSD